jgi:hypothetical protein
VDSSLPEYEWVLLGETNIRFFVNMMFDGSMDTWLRLYSQTHGYCVITKAAVQSRSVCVPPELQGVVLNSEFNKAGAWVHVDGWSEVVSHGVHVVVNTSSAHVML